MRTTVFLKAMLVVAVLSVGMDASAYDFETDGLRYEVLSKTDKTVKVTNEGMKDSYNGFFEVIIPENVTYEGVTYTVTAIGDGAFSYWKDLIFVDIANTVTEIGNNAFSNCSSLRTVDFGNSLTTIKDNAFEWCVSLMEVDFPNTLTFLGMHAFNWCNSLITVDLPASLKYYIWSFGGCRNLKAINVDVANPNFDSYEGALYSEGLYTLYTVPCSWTTYEFPEETRVVADLSFYGCDNITTIFIPETITEIISAPFQNCANLEEINVDEYNRYYASIDGVLYTKDITMLHSCPVRKTEVEIPNTVETIDRFAFLGCHVLEDIEIPNSVTFIDHGAFQSCMNLSEIEIPNSVTSIGYDAFSYCTGLTSVTIGSSVETIDYEIFDGCNSIKTVFCMSQVPPVSKTRPASCFTEETYASATLYVPQGTKEDYGAIEPWSQFDSIEEQAGSGIGEVALNKDEVSIAVAGGSIVIGGACVGVEVYSLDGIMVYSGTGTTVSGLPSGTYVVKAGSKTAKVFL